jgi:hypothetical protein
MSSTLLQRCPEGGQEFDPYFVPDDWARLQYRPFVERLLMSEEADNERLDAELRAEGHSLRTIMREIPPVFGDFY